MMKRKMILWVACLAVLSVCDLAVTAGNNQVRVSQNDKPQAVKYWKSKIRVDGQKIMIAGKEVKAITFKDGTNWQRDKDGELNGKIKIGKKSEITVGGRVVQQISLADNSVAIHQEECSCWVSPPPPPPPPGFNKVKQNPAVIK